MTVKSQVAESHIIYAAHDAYPRWLAGLCPCCGGEIGPWEWEGIDHQPATIGEGVRICGRCAGNNHMTRGVDQLLLEAIALGARQAR